VQHCLSFFFCLTTSINYTKMNNDDQWFLCDRAKYHFLAIFLSSTIFFHFSILLMSVVISIFFILLMCFLACILNITLFYAPCHLSMVMNEFIIVCFWFVHKTLNNMEIEEQETHDQF